MLILYHILSKKATSKGDFFDRLRYYLSILKDEPEVMTVMEAAKILRLGKNKTYDLVNSGRLSSIKVGGRIIIPKMCIVAFLTDSNNFQK